MVDGDRGHTSQREHVKLLHGLVVRSEVSRSEHITVDQSLERIHAVENDHGSALTEDRKVRDKRLGELMEQASHRPVSEERRLGNKSLPFSGTWDMVLAGEDSFPVAAGHHLVHLVLHVTSSLLNQLGRVRDIDDVAQLILVDSTIVVEVSLMSEGLKSVHVEVQIEITGHNRSFSE